tara:strand:- start:1088 stop:1345 length:258 start_codon:yes stop_codon:yes gene_type:complete
MQTKFPFKNGTMFMITYTPQTIGGEVNHNRKHITRRGKWNDKCKVNKNFILYYDRDRGNYRYASNKLAPIYVSLGLNMAERKAIN